MSDVSTLILDGQNLAWRSAHSAMGTKGADLGYKGQPTSVIFGVMRSIDHLIRVYRPASIVVGWDRHKPKWRTEVCPDYKANRGRDKKPEEREQRAQVLSQIGELHSVLPSLGVISVMRSYIEADDLCAAGAQILEGDNVVVSTDEDMLQLLDERTRVYSPVKDCELTLATLGDDIGVRHELYPAYRALVGDSSDNLRGAVGIGPAKARVLLSECANGARNSVDALQTLFTARDKWPGKEAAWAAFIAQRDSVMATLAVMSLHEDRSGARNALMRAVAGWKPFDRMAYYSFVGRYGLQSLLDSGVAGQLASLRRPSVVDLRNLRTPVVWSGLRGV